jgi:acyl-[acyl-carrier-protein]-phospholipid O-acyltransferase/long-chain-fatty-acid--[acyl-carrier-protein] ligase
MHNKPSTVGRIMPGIKIKFEEIDGIVDGKKLLVKGPNIMKGYLLASNPEKIIPPQDGWYDTGDIVSIDENGFISIKGRFKRFAKIAGEMVSLTATEINIAKIDPKSAHAIVAIPDPKKGEQLILMTTSQTLKRADISTFFRENQITELSVPKEIIVVEKLPLLGTGKVDYVKVKELASQTSS